MSHLLSVVCPRLDALPSWPAITYLDGRCGSCWCRPPSLTSSQGLREPMGYGTCAVKTRRSADFLAQAQAADRVRIISTHGIVAVDSRRSGAILRTGLLPGCLVRCSLQRPGSVGGGGGAGGGGGLCSRHPHAMPMVSLMDLRLRV